MFHNRAIIHLDLDAFFVSVEVKKNSILEGKPVLIGGTSGRGVVSSCSYEARRYGIHSAMPMRVALRRCPDAIVIKGDFESYSQHSKMVAEIIREQAPIFEQASIDEFYLDVSGLDKYFGCWQWSKELRQRIIKETGLPISFGLSNSKTVSKIGTGEAKPNGEQLVESGTEKAFIAPLSTRKIPYLGKRTFQKLALMGVHKIHTLSEIPPRLLEREFGKNGISLWKKANAIDDSPVVPYDEKKSISTEKTFQIDTIEVRQIKAQLTKMVMKLAFELRQSQKLTSCITIKIRYSDFNTFTQQKKISFTANDQTLIQTAHWLFDKLFFRRQLIRLVGVKFSGLVGGHYQIQLFEDTEEEIALLNSMDKIRKRFGHDLVKRASTL